MYRYTFIIRKGIGIKLRESIKMKNRLWLFGLLVIEVKVRPFGHDHLHTYNHCNHTYKEYLQPEPEFAFLFQLLFFFFAKFQQELLLKSYFVPSEGITKNVHIWDNLVQSNHKSVPKLSISKFSFRGPCYWIIVLTVSKLVVL